MKDFLSWWFCGRWNIYIPKVRPILESRKSVKARLNFNGKVI